MWREFANPREWLQRWEHQRSLVGDDGGVVLVVCGGEPAGFIDWGQHQWFGRMCWSLGIQLAPSMVGRGIGTRAHQLLVAYLFRDTLMNSIEAYTDAENVAERRVLEKSGFTLEGTLHGAAFRDGRWRDGVLYSITRPTGVRPALREQYAQRDDGRPHMTCGAIGNRRNIVPVPKEIDAPVAEAFIRLHRRSSHRWTSRPHLR